MVCWRDTEGTPGGRQEHHARARSSGDSVADRLKAARKLKGLSQLQLARRANLSQSLVKKVAQGSKPPSAAFVAGAARVLGIRSPRCTAPGKTRCSTSRARSQPVSPSCAVRSTPTTTPGLRGTRSPSTPSPDASRKPRRRLSCCATPTCSPSCPLCCTTCTFWPTSGATPGSRRARSCTTPTGWRRPSPGGFGRLTSLRSRPSATSSSRRPPATRCASRSARTTAARATSSTAITATGCGFSTVRAGTSPPGRPTAPSRSSSICARRSSPRAPATRTRPTGICPSRVRSPTNSTRLRRPITTWTRA
ncbi:helix-turn-helix domain-containing protein [Amycolatopsis sp. FDAARGOS 1241]|nr:helix-turn-helix domain-containing protein [Amycolatopsis sp. FDAARGOS 1241]